MSIKTVSRWVGRWGAVCGLLMTGMFLAGCKGGAANTGFSQVPGDTGSSVGQDTGTSTAVAANAAKSDTSDRIHPGDTLLITFSDTPIIVQSAVEERVKDDGT